MTCEDLKSRLYDLAEGVLSPEEQSDLRAQLEVRPECQELLRSIECLHQALPEWKCPSPSPSFVSRTLAAVRVDAATRIRVTETVELAGPSILSRLLGLFQQRLRVPVPVGVVMLALLLLSALINLKFLLGDSEVAPNAGPGLNPTKVNTTGTPVEQKRPDSEILLIESPGKDPSHRAEDEGKKHEEKKEEEKEDEAGDSKAGGGI